MFGDKIGKKLKAFSKMKEETARGIISMKKEEYKEWEAVMERIIDG